LFQRVLSSVPDDFVAHIGMSIIREDEDNLDAGIWHMERAFEVQPSNRAVQDELRRLYGKREGYEPAKVRLTRGALARMYSHGDLYNQAIGELRSALAEDPQRPDLQVLLAEMYFKTNQHTQAIEVCSQIIQKLPYCLYANRVMVDILRNSQRDVEANPYWERVEELDPYAAQVSTLKDVEQAPAETATIEQLELDEPRSLTPPKAWTSSLQMPEGFEQEKEELPDWLSLDNLETPTAETETAQGESVLSSLHNLEPGATSEEPAAPEAEIAEEKPASPFHSVSKSTALRADQIPDWLRELRPMTGSLTPPAAAQAEPEPETPEAQRWTDELKKAGFKPTGPLDLDNVEQHEAEKTAPMPPKEVIAGLGTTELRWLDTDLGGEPDDNAPASETPANPAAAPAENELPDWLNELNQEDRSKPAPSMSALGDTPPVAKEPEPAVRPNPNPAAVGSLAASWLDELKAESGMADEPEAEEAAPISDDNSTSRLDDLARWETQPTSAAEAKAEPEQPAASQEDEDNLSWLEGLAAKQGAAEEELLTTPEERKLAKPEWLQASQVGPEAEPAKSEALSWLDELSSTSSDAPAELSARPSTEELEPLEDFNDLNEPAREGETPIEEAPPAQPEQGETTPAWLRQLSAEMESGIRPAAEPIAPRPLEEAPDWLKELSPENAAQAETIEESVDEAAKLVESQPETMDEDLGSVDWLDSESEEAVETSPTIEPTWMPANEMGEQNEEPQAEAEPMMSAEEREPVPPVAQPATAAKSAPAPEPVAEPQGAKRQGGVRRRTTLLDPEQVEDRLGQARQALSYGNIGDAVEAYGYMLRRRIRLDEVIADLRAALRRFPRQVTLWQALGDAYMRNNQLKDALECYTKAETLL
jgi:tetratricopeptide (TPR) repeat protein